MAPPPRRLRRPSAAALAAAPAAAGSGAWAVAASVDQSGAGCPSPEEALDLAAAVWGFTWAKMRCAQPFDIEAASAEVRGTAAGSCEVLVSRWSGDLRFELEAGASRQLADVEGMVTGAAMRRSAASGWEAVTERLCLLSAFAGVAPVSSDASPSMRSFAISAINAARAKRSCGKALLPGPEASRPFARAAVVERGAEVRFPVRVCAAEPRGPCHGGAPPAVLLAAVAVAMTFDRITQRAAQQLRFLGTDPDPCAVATPDAPGVSAWRLLAPEAQAPPARHGLPEAGAAGVAGAGGGAGAGARAPGGGGGGGAAGGPARARAAMLLRAGLRSRRLWTLPEHFDFIDEWPACAGPPAALGVCAASWAVAVAGAWDKQVCAQSGGGPRRSSAQWLLDCARGAGGCDGGRVEAALAALYTEGAMPEACAPYRAPPRGLAAPEGGEPGGGGGGGAGAFDAPEGYNLSSAGGDAASSCGRARRRAEARERREPGACRRLFARGPTVLEEALLAGARRPVEWAGVVHGAEMIQAAILAYGAVVALVEVYADFLAYTAADGVYRRARAIKDSDCLGNLAVQLAGWGQREEAPFWIGEAGFGRDWGDGGRFRWIRGEDHLGIERRAWLPFIEGVHPLGPGDNAGLDELSEWAAQAADAEARVEALRGRRGALVATNVAAVSLALLVVAVAHCCHVAAWPFDSPEAPPLSPQAAAPPPQRRGARAYRYEAVPTAAPQAAE